MESTQELTPDNKPGHRKKIIAAAMVIILFLALIGILACSVTFDPDLKVSEDMQYPYTTSYEVSFPEGKELKVGILDLMGLKTQDGVQVKIGPYRQAFKESETVVSTQRMAEIRLLGNPVLSAGYQLNTKFIGLSDKAASFLLTIRTTVQIPEALIRYILPQEVVFIPV